MIIIFKSQLNAHPEIAQGIGSLCEETAQIGTACVYVPKQDNVDELVALFKINNIHFFLHHKHVQVKNEVDKQ